MNYPCLCAYDYIITFHMYNGSGDSVRVGVNLGDTLDLTALAALGIPVTHVFGTPGAPGAALWGWFTDEQLDASGRTRNNHRRPALAAEGFDLEAIITDCMFGEDGDLYLYVIWSLWGDVNDDDQVTGFDVTLINQWLMDQWRVANGLTPQFNVQINLIAANVSIVGQVDGPDAWLINQYLFDQWRVSSGLDPQFNVVLGRIQP